MKLFKRLPSSTEKPKGPQTTMPDLPKVISKTVGNRLAEYGFKRNGQSFYRIDGELTHIINIQGSKWNHADDSEFYINLAVFHPRAYEIEWAETASKFPKEVESQLRSRLDEHAGRKVKREWKFTRNTDVNARCQLMTTAIIDHGLSYFEGLSSISDLLQALDSKKNTMKTVYTSVQRGILISLLGNQTSARKQFELYLKQNTMATQSVRRNIDCIAKDLGITLHIPDLNGESCVSFYISMKGSRPIKDERRTESKLYIYLRHLEDKGYGYMHYHGNRRKPGLYRVAFGTKDPEYVANYIRERQSKLPMPLHSLVINDEF